MNPRIVLASCAGLLTILIIVLAQIVLVEPEFAGLAFVLAVLLLAPVAIAARQGPFEVMEAIYFFLAMYGYMYLIKPLARVVAGEEFLFGRDDLEWSMAVAIIGLLAMYLGYYSRLGPSLARQVPAMDREISQRNVRWCAWMFITIGGIGLWVYMEQSGGWQEFWSLPHGLGGKVGSSTAYIWQLPELMIVGFFLILHDAITDRRVTVPVVIRILFASVGGIGVYTVLWTRRTFILWAMLSVFVMYFLSKEKRPRLTTIALFGLAIFMALQIAISYRPYLHLGSTAADLGEVELESANSIASHEGDEFDSFLAIVNFYPQHLDYDYFGIYLRIPLHPIPRLLWADKPPLFNQSWDAFLFQSGIGWGASESLVGDLYVQMGVLGVIIGMVISGVLWRFVYAYLLKAPDRRFMQLIFAVAVGNIPSYVMQSAISAFWKWFPLMIPGVIFAYWISRRRTSRPSLARPIIQEIR